MGPLRLASRYEIGPLAGPMFVKYSLKRPSPVSRFSPGGLSPGIPGIAADPPGDRRARRPAASPVAPHLHPPGSIAGPGAGDGPCDPESRVPRRPIADPLVSVGYVSTWGCQSAGALSPHHDALGHHVRVHRPKVTAVQKRTGCGSMKADPAAGGPVEIPEDASVSSGRSAQSVSSV